LLQRAAGEHVEQAEERSGSALGDDVLHLHPVHARRGDEHADPVHGQAGQREQDPPPELRDLADIADRGRQGSLRHAACGGLVVSISSADPPACSSLDLAAAENACAWTLSFLPTSPSPRIFTRGVVLGTMPAPLSMSTSTLPSSKRSAMWPTLTGKYSVRNGFLKPRLGSRRCMGIWPPSKPMRAPWWPVRAFWPLTPLPAVWPVPDPMPRP